MEGIVILTLLLSGLCLPSWCAGRHHYAFFSAKKTWAEARSHCREVCLDLATMDDMREMQAATEVTQGKYADAPAIWIGCHTTAAVAKMWHWSLADKDLYAEGERGYAARPGGTHHCGAYRDGRTFTVNCGSDIHAVCFDAGKQGAQQYVLTPVMRDWPKARDYCRSQHTDLASVRNAAEDRFLRDVSAGRTVYIGFFWDPWEWSDHTYSSMRYWQPNLAVAVTSGLRSCAAMLESYSGKWGQRSCGETLPFLCNCPALKLVKVQMLSEDPGLDLKDPTVQAGILKHIRERLNQTIPTNLQLGWSKHPDGVFRRKNPKKALGAF